MEDDSIHSPRLLAYAQPGTLPSGVNSLAVCAAVAGILSLVLFYADYSGLRAWILSRPTIAVSGTTIAVSLAAILVGCRRRGAAWSARLTWLAFIGLFAGAAPLATAVIAPRRPYCCYTPPRYICQSHLREIGQAAWLYANENGGRVPDDMAEFFTQDLVPGVFVCPATNDTPAIAGPTTQATGASVEAPGHCSYVYLGKYWMSDELTPDVVLAYEPLKNHQGLGMNVLYGDGHVDWVEAKEAKTVLAELAAGHNPPRIEVIHESMRSYQTATSEGHR